MKFTFEEGQVTVSFNIVNKTTLQIKVSDKEQGMSPEHVSAFNNSKPIKQKVATSGEQSYVIGLDHVKNLVQQEGVKIALDSKKHIGSSFKVILPII